MTVIGESIQHSERRSWILCVPFTNNKLSSPSYSTRLR